MTELPLRLRELTPFEHDVMQLVCDGLSNAAIANRTRHSEKVIENTVSRTARAFAIKAGPDINVRVLLALAYRSHFGDNAFNKFGIECQFIEIGINGERTCSRHL
jgi:DNA-binding NarL/FixJ family response regulator